MEVTSNVRNRTIANLNSEADFLTNPGVKHDQEVSILSFDALLPLKFTGGGGGGGKSHRKCGKL